MGASACQSEHDGMGTAMAHVAYGPRAQEALDAVRAEAQRLESCLSRFLPGSDVSALNRSAGAAPVKIGAEAWDVLSSAAAFSRATQGMFDVSIAPLVDLWNWRCDTEAPEESRILKILPLVNHNDLLLDLTHRTARLRHPGQSVDAGGIAKGYASDRLMDVFREYGVTSAFTNIGGNVSTLGGKPDGSPWRVGIRHPRQPGDLLGAVAVTGRSVVTSGDYERYFTDSHGARWHHILDPATGYPARSGLMSVTVVDDSAMTADALSTALFVAGLKKGSELLRQYPKAEAVFVDAQERVFVTQGLKGCFQAAAGIGIYRL